MGGDWLLVLAYWALVVCVGGWRVLSPIRLLVSWWLSILVVGSVVWSSVVVVCVIQELRVP